MTIVLFAANEFTRPRDFDLDLWSCDLVIHSFMSIKYEVMGPAEASFRLLNNTEATGSETKRGDTSSRKK